MKRTNLRQLQAQETAATILRSARELFLERGYACTTIEAIAESAGVAVSTVYAVYGSKRSILRGMRTPWHEQSHIREVVTGDGGHVPPEERLEQLATATAQQWESGAQVVAIYESAAAADPDAAEELKLALAGRRKGMEHFAHNLAPYLRQDLDSASAAAIIQALCLPAVFQELVHHSGWPVQAYRDWLAQALKRELLPEKV